jgi:hypothetical protein
VTARRKAAPAPATTPEPVPAEVLAHYTIAPDPDASPPTLHTGRKYLVRRGPDVVAALWEDPSLTGGRPVYDDRQVRVSLSALRWSGPHEIREGSPDARRGVGCLFYDFGTPGITSAVEALPEVARRVEAALAWRRQYAAVQLPVSVSEHRASLRASRSLPAGMSALTRAHDRWSEAVERAEVVELEGEHALVWRSVGGCGDGYWHVDVLARRGVTAHEVNTEWTREDALVAARALLGRVVRLALGGPPTAGVDAGAAPA